MINIVIESTLENTLFRMNDTSNDVCTLVLIFRDWRI